MPTTTINLNDQTAIVEVDVLEDTSHKIQGQLKDVNGNNLVLGALSTITLTLFLPKTGTIVNGRNNQNVLNANDVTIDANGLLIWAVQPEDTAIIDTANRKEVHRALFQFVDTGGNQGKKRVDITVHNLAKVP